MNRTLFLVFNHELLPEQEADARRTLGVTRFEAMPPEVRVTWSNVPPDAEGIDSYLTPVRTWLKSKAKAGDCALVQGDFGACFLIVRFAETLGLLAVYATTARETVEDRATDGTITVTRLVRHRRFRRYGQ